MMKKVLCVLLTVLMLLSMVACGKTPADPVKTTVEPTETTQKNQETTEQTEPNNDEEMQMQQFMFPLVKVYCNVPEEYERVSRGCVALAIKNDAFVASVHNGDIGAYSGELEGILEFVAEDYLFETNIFLYKEIAAEELKASTVEAVTVSGYDAVKFGGPVKNIGNTFYEIYGYAMIIEDRPVVFMGILCSEDQAQADLEEMQELVDLMAGSIYK